MEPSHVVFEMQRKELQSVIKLQDLLMNLSLENYDDTLDFFNSSIWSFKKSLFKQFVHNIIITSIYRPYSNPLLAKLISSIVNDMDEQSIFKDLLLSEIFDKLLSRAYKQFSSAICMFLFNSVHYCLFQVDEIVKKVNSYKKDSDKFEKIAFFVFVWLAPEIENNDNVFFQDCLNICKRWTKDIEILYPTVGRFLYELDKMKANNWAMLKQRRTSDSTLKIFSAIFKRNDVEDLIQLSFHPQFNINQKIAYSIYEPSFFVSYMPTLIEFAAFCSAIDCFQYLAETSADLTETDNNNKTLAEFMVASGNHEIINMSKSIEIDCSPYMYLLSEFHYPIKELSEKILLAACKSNNIKVINDCLNKVDFNCIDEKNKTPLIYASEFGNLDAIRIILKMKDINKNCKDIDGMTPLQYACQNGYEDIVKLLLSFDDVDVSSGNKICL